MPKNKGKGGKNRRRGKNENDNEKRELTFKEDGQEYAQVVKMLGYVTLSLSSRKRLWHRTAKHFLPPRAACPWQDATCGTYADNPSLPRRNGRLEAQCFDGTRRLGNIRGKLRKKVWINQGDIILLSLRDYQDDKGDVMYVATPPPLPPSQATTSSVRNPRN